MAIIELIQNDKLFNLTFTVKDAEDVVVDLTTATILFKMYTIGAISSKVSAGCTITSAPNGACYYTVQAGDLDTTGMFHAELEITYSGGKIITAELDDIKVVKEAP